MPNLLRILVLEDLVTDYELMLRELRKAGLDFTARRVETEADFRQQLHEFAPHLVLADYSLPGYDGLSALELARRECPQVPFIFVSGTMGEENAIEALVGQIQDEFDAEKSELVQLGENLWEAAGTLPLHDLDRIIGTVPHDENTTTASGWVTEKLGGFPRVGDLVAVGNFELRVEEMDGPRVGKLKVTRKS